LDFPEIQQQENGDEFPPLPRQFLRFPRPDRPKVERTPAAQNISKSVRNSLQIHHEDVLKERGGIFAYRAGTYAVTLDRGFITVENPAWMDGIGHPGLSYRLCEIRAGDVVIASGDWKRSPEARAGERTVSYRYGSIEERYSLEKNLLEQDFVIRELPASRGAIIVTGTVSTNLAPPPDGTTGASLSFTHEGRELLSFSKAVAVDSAGRKLALDIAYDAGRVSITVPASWVAIASLPITIDPVIGSPITVDSSLQSANYQVSDLSFNTSRRTWLVIWNEWAGSSFGKNVYGQLIDADGNLLGGQLLIGAAAVDEWGGTVSYAPAPIDRWLVTWVYLVGGSNGAQIRGCVLNGDGTFYKPSFMVDDRANADFFPTVAHDGSQWHVSWTNLFISSTATPGTILGRFVSTAGVPGAIADVETTAALYQTTASETFGNGRYAFLWRSGIGATAQLLARTMDTAGSLSPVIAVASPGASIASAQIVPGPPNKLLLVWSAGNSVQGRLADANLNFLAPAFSIWSGAECSAAYSTTSGKWLVVVGAGNLSGVLVDASGAVSPPEFLAAGTPVGGTYAPRVAWNSVANEMLAIYNVFPAFGSIQNLKAVRYAMPAALDTTPPSVSITAPLNGAAVSGIVAMSANAGDNVGIARVGFLAGGALVATAASPPYSAAWDSTLVPDGTIVLTAKAYDAAGNSAVASVTVTVSNQNPPPLTATITTLTPPTINPGPTSAVADLKITISGGIAGQRTAFNFMVFLNANLAAVPDTAQLIDPSGTTFPATKAGNSYIFMNVPLDQPGLNATRVFTITNMKANTASMTAPAQVSAFVSIVGSAPITVSNPVSTVALVTAPSACIFSITGPSNVPGLSKYRYAINVPAGGTATAISWTVDRPPASFEGATNQVEAVVKFQNTRADMVGVKAMFTLNGNEVCAVKQVALVKVEVDPAKLTNPGKASEYYGSEVFLVNAPAPPAAPKWVTTHDPGSQWASFTYNGAKQPAEPKVIVQSKTDGGDPAFKAETKVTLTSPAEKPDALQKIQVGFIQHASDVGSSSYTGGLRRTVATPTGVTLDWLAKTTGPGPTDEWPWFDKSARKTGAGTGSWSDTLKMDDSPDMSFPSQYNPNDAADPDKNEALASASETSGFVIRIAARTLDNDLGADKRYFAEANSSWRVNFPWPVTAGVSIVNVGPDWTRPADPSEVDINVVPAAINANAPFFRWKCATRTCEP
jgi:hypothetical protein